MSLGNTQKEITLEYRKCRACDHEFRVMVGSSQKFCNSICSQQRQTWKRLKESEQKHKEKKIVSVFVNDGKTQNSVKNKNKNGKHIPLNARTRSVRVESDTTKITKNDSMKSEPKIEEETRNETMNTNENIMNETKTEVLENRLTMVNDDVTPPLDYIKPNKITEMVTSASMNLIDSTATHLHELMIGLNKDQPTTEVKLCDPERVKTACGCAKEIRELMKLKLEAIKVQKGLT